MAEETLLPWIAERTGEGRIGSRVFSAFGLSESRLDELLTGVMNPTEGRLSFRAAFPRLQARITVTGATDAEVAVRLDDLEGRVRERLGDHLYAIGDEGLEETVGRILRARQFTLAVAESCTGGLIGHRLTEVPGSSDYFLLGVTAYSNRAKARLLGVSPTTLEEFGAVSEETVLEMARGVRTLGGASVGMATSGIAGPGGGSDGKPVGTVWIALAWEGGEWARKYEFGSRSRGWIKQIAAMTALDQLRRLVPGLATLPPPDSTANPSAPTTSIEP